MSIEDRLAAPLKAEPELCSLNMGSMNFGIFHAGAKITDWKYDWEKPYIEKTRESIVSNTFAQIEHFIEQLGKGCGTRFECECYDVGHLYTLAHYLDRKLLEPPLFVQTIFGILGGIGAHPEDLMHMRRTADRLFGNDYQWSILAAGRHQMTLTTIGATMGGNVRVGLEDSIYLGPGTLAKSNAEQVSKIRRILSELSLDVATPDEARAHAEAEGRRPGCVLSDDEPDPHEKAAASGCAKRSRPARPTHRASRATSAPISALSAAAMPACGPRLRSRRAIHRIDVAIVEADICGGGASGRNSGMVLSQWAKFAALKSFCGEAGALALGRAFGQSADGIEAFCRDKGIDAEFRRDGWIWGATCAKHVGSWKGIIESLGQERRGSVPGSDECRDCRTVRHRVVSCRHLRSDRCDSASGKACPRVAPSRAEQGRADLRKLCDDAARARRSRHGPHGTGQDDSPHRHPHDECLVGLDPRTRFGHSGDRQR